MIPSTIEHLLIVWAIQIKPYSAQIAIAFTTASLVVYGHIINKLVMRIVSKQNVIIRILCFCLLCTIGYGAMTVLISIKLIHLMSLIPEIYFIATILAAFTLLGILSEYHCRK